MRRRVVDKAEPIPDTPYLRVAPTIIWVGGNFLIASNTIWLIE